MLFLVAFGVLLELLSAILVVSFVNQLRFTKGCIESPGRRFKEFDWLRLGNEINGFV